jgi:hypothetical protein
MREEAPLKGFVHDHHAWLAGSISFVEVSPGDQGNSCGGEESGQHLVPAGIHVFAVGWPEPFNMHRVLPVVVR